MNTAFLIFTLWRKKKQENVQSIGFYISLIIKEAKISLSQIRSLLKGLFS